MKFRFRSTNIKKIKEHNLSEYDKISMVSRTRKALPILLLFRSVGVSDIGHLI